MKIIINGKTFVKKYKTGVQRYFSELMKEIDKQIEKNEIEILVPKYCEENISYKNIKIVRYGHLEQNLWEQIELPFYAKKNKGVIVNLCNTLPIINPGIVCIHDINYIRNPQYYPKLFSLWYKIMLKSACKRAKKIITVSNFSKKEIESYTNVKNIEVISNGYEHIKQIKQDKGILEKLKVKDYYFSLGTIQKSKNIEWITNIARLNPKETFVITGYKNEKNIKFNLKNVIYTGYLTDEEIKALMQNCKSFIFPSYYEGFGLPALEAMALNKNIIVSDIPVMHEIYGEEINYINPYDYNINLSNLNKVMTMNDRNKILEKYSWTKSANKILQLFKLYENMDVDNKEEVL